MSRLSEIFRARGKCFIPFVTAGHPDLESTLEIVLRLAGAGSDIVEIGIPFSDPIADGPVIQASSFQALKHHYSMADYLDLVRRIRTQSDVGLIFMTYVNPVLSHGLDRLGVEAREAGLDGLLISDMTPEEHRRLGEPRHIDTVFLAAPTSTDARLEQIARASRGFVYLVARTGVTGKHSDVGEAVADSVARLRRHTDLPIAVGFGISSRADVEKVWRHADGAVVGSAIVRFIEENRQSPDLPARVGAFVRDRLLPATRPSAKK